MIRTSLNVLKKKRKVHGDRLGPLPPRSIAKQSKKITMAKVTLNSLPANRPEITNSSTITANFIICGLCATPQNSHIVLNGEFMYIIAYVA